MIDLTSIKAVFFDADDTLFKVHPGVAEIYSEVAASHGITASVGTLKKKLPDIWKGFKDEYENAHNNYETHPQREREMWATFSRRTLESFAEGRDISSLVDELYLEFAKSRTRILFPGIEALLEFLQAKKLVLGVLTNNDSRIVNVVKEFNLAHRFDHIIPTADLGYKKPSPHAFKAVEIKIGITSQHILYIGDSYENDYLAALNAGWRALWFNERKRPHNEYGVKEFDSFITLKGRLNDLSPQ